MNIVYLTFGEKTNIHVQAYLSILSFRKQMDDSDRIVIVTTAPSFIGKHGNGQRLLNWKIGKSKSGKDVMITFSV